MLSVVIFLVFLTILSTVSYRVGRGRRRLELTKHKHTWAPWELTGETRKRFRESTGTYSYPIQKRQCLDCGYTQQEEVKF